MARFAIIHPDTNEVLEILAAPEDFPITAPEWMRLRFKKNIQDPTEVPCAPLFIEVVTESETPTTKTFVVSRECEVGGRYRKAQKRFDRNPKEREETREERLERRLSVLEARLGQ